MADTPFTEADKTAPSDPQPAALWRRLAALFYDGLFVLAILIFATFLLLPVTQGEAIPDHGLWHWLYQLYLLAWVATYFSLFWCIGGQTPGMKVWHIKVVMPRCWCFFRGVARFLGGLVSIALLGIPFWLAMRNPQRRSLVDRWLRTRVIRT